MGNIQNVRHAVISCPECNKEYEIKKDGVNCDCGHAWFFNINDGVPRITKHTHNKELDSITVTIQ